MRRVQPGRKGGSMKLYTVPLAPNPTKVMLYIAERTNLGVSFEIEMVIVNTLKGRHKEAAHLARNPFGTLPVLELEDGRFIRESRVIIDYLEDIYPDHPLFDRDCERRAEQRDLERICDVRLAQYINHWVHVYKSPLGVAPNPARAAELEKSMIPAFTYIEAYLSDGRAFLCGDRPSPADCTLQSTLNFMRFTGKNLIADYDHIQKWDAAYRQRACVAAALSY